MIKPINNKIYAIYPPSDSAKNGLLMLPEKDMHKTELIVVAVAKEIKDIFHGDRIIIKKYAGTEIGGEKPGLLVDYNDVLAKYNSENE